MGFRMKIFMKLFTDTWAIFFTFLPTSNHLHPLQVKNCGSNSRLIDDENDNGKFGAERVNKFIYILPVLPDRPTRDHIIYGVIVTCTHILIIS